MFSFKKIAKPSFTNDRRSQFGRVVNAAYHDDLLTLESRVLYSAGPVPADMADVVDLGEVPGAADGTIVPQTMSDSMVDMLAVLQQLPDDSEVDVDATDTSDPTISTSSRASSSAVTLLVPTASRPVSLSLVPATTSVRSTSASISISGTIHHDVNGDGDVTDAGTEIFEGAEVFLIRDRNGDGELGTPDFASGADFRAVTDVNGRYTFNGLDDNETYFVVVDSQSLSEVLANTGQLNTSFSADDVLAEQTYAGEGALFRADSGGQRVTTDSGAFFGGFSRTDADDASRLGRGAGSRPTPGDTFEHVIRRDVGTASIDNVDFGFSFNVVTHNQNSPDSTQGSFQQFIHNANAIAGANTMRFVPIGPESGTAFGVNYWSVELTSALPAITDAGTTIDGRAYSTAGELLTASIPLGSGTGPSGQSVGGTLVGPDLVPNLELVFNGPAANNSGLQISAEDVDIGYVSIRGFSNGIFVDERGNRANIHDNIIGASPDGSASSTRNVQNFGINVENADDGVIENNYVLDSQVSGIGITGSVFNPLGTGHAANWQITSNRISQTTASPIDVSDGISLHAGTDGAVIAFNLIENSREFGIDLWNNRGSVQVTDNRIVGGGDSVTGGGIHLTAAGNSVLRNELIDITGTGIIVSGSAVFGGSPTSGGTNIESAIGNRISQNYFENITLEEIDITEPSSLPGANVIATGDGLDTPDGVFNPNQGSNGIDRPTLDSVSLVSDALVIRGSHMPQVANSTLEIYLLGNNGSRVFIAEASNSSSSSSFNLVTGEFELVIDEPAAGWPVELTSGTAEIAATLIDNASNNTSEFSDVITVLVSDTPPVNMDSSVTFDESTTHTFNLSDFSPTDTDIDAVRIERLPASGQLLLDGGALAGPAEITIAQLNAGELTFQPDQATFGPNLASFDFAFVEDSRFGPAATLTINVDSVEHSANFDLTSDRFETRENSTDVVQFSGQDLDNEPIRFEIVGGPDASLFVIDSTTGQLSFIAPPDFELNEQSGVGNSFELTVRVEDFGGLGTSSNFFVDVTDVPENSAPRNSPPPEGESESESATSSDEGETTGLEPEIGMGLMGRPNASDDSDDEDSQQAPNPAILILDHMAPSTEFSQDEEESETIDLSLGILSNRYSYIGRTQFIELSSQALQEDTARFTSTLERDVTSTFSLGMLANQQDSEQTFLGELQLPVGYEKIIVTTGTFFSVGAMSWIVRTGLAVSGSVFSTPHLYQFLDVGTLLDPDYESIENIVDSKK